MQDQAVAAYRFLTTWLLDAPLEPIWKEIEDAERWPEWWRGVLRADKVRAGDEDGVGMIVDTVWRSAVPYAVRFRGEVVRNEPPHEIALNATGELNGTGTWRFFTTEELTAVTYDWDVRTSRAWMNAAAPVARPVFAWNHHVIMRWGGEGLARRLGAELVAST